MKKSIIIAALVAAVVGAAAFANGVENKTNMSPRIFTKSEPQCGNEAPRSGLLQYRGYGLFERRLVLRCGQSIRI